jgi:hypothetical protein
MALGYSAALRNIQLEQIELQTDGGTGAAFLRIYDGTRPATGGAISGPVLLAELTFSDPSYLAASGGSMTANAITQDSSANAGGTASWFRVVQSDGTTHVMDGTVHTSTGDLNLNSLSITLGGTVAVTSWAVSAGNA